MKVTIGAYMTGSAIKATSSFNVIIKDPCDFSTLTQPAGTALDREIGWLKNNPHSIIYTPKLPTNAVDATRSCKPDSYVLSATLQSGTLDISSSVLSSTSTDTTVTVKTVVPNNDLAGVYNAKLTYVWTNGRSSIDVSFTITIIKCLTTINISPTWPLIPPFNIEGTSPITYEIPLTITQTHTCGASSNYLTGYPYSLNAVLSNSDASNSYVANNIAVDLTDPNKSKALITISPTVDTLN